MSYRATASTTGNSKALRLEAALFREHPEFATGEFDVTVLAPGCLLVYTTGAATLKDDTDPVFDAFLRFLETQMQRRPDLLSPVTVTDREEAAAILRGVRAEPDDEIDEHFQLPQRRRPVRAGSRMREGRSRNTGK